MKLATYLHDGQQPGDKIQCKIENLGTLTNTVGNPPAQFYKPLKK